MTPVSAVVVFVVIWWLVLFVVLPRGVERDREPEPGNDPGAPVQAMMWRKAAITTLITVVLFAAVYGIIESGLIPLRDIVEGKQRLL